MSKIVPLKRCVLFQDFSFAELSMLAPFFKEGKLAAGKQISQRGSVSDGLTVVASGAITLKHANPSLNLNLEMGGYFGDLGLVVSNSQAEFDITALEETELLKLTHENFQKIKMKHGPLALKLLEGSLKALQKNISLVKELLAK
ncbi:MAG: cyclic nucleotide-binding domain-containing protein [Bdellovibrionales bacterium]|nr:cyclic nucleotide-binding domain-containing protein [Bdellovibrionales bacterium]